jgi:hypothetical protein
VLVLKHKALLHVTNLSGFLHGNFSEKCRSRQRSKRYFSKYNQQDATLHNLFLWNALHVSVGSSAHHQELKTVYTTSGICQTFSATAVEEFQLLNNSSREQKRFDKFPMLYIQFWAPDDRRRNRLKHVEHFTEINKLCNVASCWLYLEIYLRCTDPWTSKLQEDWLFIYYINVIL